jgi:DNA helicase IV
MRIADSSKISAPAASPGSITDLSRLNERQREAVTSDAKALLVLAGAGSGKTRTLLQKIIYLVEEKGVSPHSIMAVTFTKNAANEMIDRLIIAEEGEGDYAAMLADNKRGRAENDRERIRRQRKYRWIDGLTVRTFHSFCYQLLRHYGVKEFDNKFRIVGDEKRPEDDEWSKWVAPETAFEVFHKLLIELCEDREYLLKLKRYILDYMVDKVHLSKDYLNRSVRDGRFYTCLDGTRVRSKSEQFIGDWFYRNNIKYEYEPALKVSDFTFHPDFYLPGANLYLEHVSDKSSAMRNKEEQFRKGNLLFVKTFEPMTRDSAFFTHTLDSIVRSRLPAEYAKEVTLSYREAFNGYMEEVKDFVAQIMRITDMMKVENTDMEAVYARALSDQHERVRVFYELARPVVRRYIDYCVDKSYLDFNDMISRSISLLRNHADIAAKFRNKYRYILVDEFQDVNNLQVELLKLLLTENTQLFCVGDDWQSIYGFRGSNVSYIIDFEKHFDRAGIIVLNLNYRSTQHIVEASNEVIRNNKFRIEKDIRASKKSEHKIVVYAGSNEEENLAFCSNKVRELLDEGVEPEEILFLYRRSKMYTPYFHYFRKEGLAVQGRTIHSAKGLEARVVFILGLTEGYGGFPDIWLEDRIFQMIKEANYDLLMEEERRLFYVAITRAKEKLFLITEKGSESGFLKEIPEKFTVRTGIPTAAVVGEQLLCEGCFSQIERIWLFCPYCGNKLEPVAGE